MTRWDEAYENHDLHNSIDNLRSKLESLRKSEELRDQDRIQDLDRIDNILNLLETKLSLTDPTLVQNALINNVNKDVINITSQLQQFESSKNIGHINNANNNADTILNRTSNLNINITNKDFDNLSDNITTFKRSLGQHSRHLKEKIEELEDKIPDLNKEFESLKGQIQNQKKRTDEIITNFQKQFSESQEKRVEEYSTNKEERQKQFSDQLEEFSTQLTNELTEKENLAQNKLNSIQDNLDKASEIVQIINNSSIAGGFEEVAQNERTARDWFRGGAITSLIMLIGFAIFVFFEYANESMDITAIGIRVFVASVLGILIAYLAKQAEKHERHYRKNKLTALQMATLDPYLAKLDPDKQKELKEKLTEVFFYRKKDLDSNNLKEGEFITRGNVTDVINFFKDLRT